MAAIVIVITSSGIFNKPIKPSTPDDAMILGTIATRAYLIDLKRTKNMRVIARKTTPMVKI